MECGKREGGEVAVSSNQLRLLHNAAKQIGVIVEEADIALAAVEHARAAFSADMAVLLLSEPDSPLKFDVCACRGSVEEAKPPPSLREIKVECHCIVNAQKAIGISDLSCESGEANLFYSDFSFAPLEIGGEIKGLLGIKRRPESLISGELELLCGMASVAAVALEQARARARAVVEERNRLRLARYFSPQVSEYLLSAGAKDIETAIRCEATVLFSDIRGFTALSERQDPAKVMDFLNKYFSEMTALVFEHGGMVDKLLGDGMMAIFGAPAPLERHALAAVRCAAAMAHSARKLRFKTFNMDSLKIGVGIHTGPVLVGNLGGDSFLDFTVLGATVNLASRIESLTKEFGVDILISETTQRQAGDEFPTTPHGPVSARGLSEPIKLFSLSNAA